MLDWFIQILNRYWKRWKKLHNVQFQFNGNLIEGSLDEKRGRGWDASTVGPYRVGAPVLWLSEWCSWYPTLCVCPAVVGLN